MPRLTRQLAVSSSQRRGLRCNRRISRGPAMRSCVRGGDVAAGDARRAGLDVEVRADLAATARCAASPFARRAVRTRPNLPGKAGEHRRWSAAVRCPASRLGPDRRPGGPQGLRVPELLGRPGLRGRRHARRRHPRPRQPEGRSASSPRLSRTTTARARTWSRSTCPASRATSWRSTTRPTGRTSRSNSDCAPADKTGGGFDLYDVSDPAEPGAARRRASATPTTTTTLDRRRRATSRTPTTPCSCGRTARGRTWSASDNIELTDVDIFDITNPTGAGAWSATTTWSSCSRRSSTARSQRRRGLPPRHGRQADRRQADPARPTTGTPATSSST